MIKKRKSKRRRQTKRRQAKRSPRDARFVKKFDLKKYFFLFGVFILTILLLYSFVILSGISTRDILSENLSRHSFLSSAGGDLEKTMFIIERERPSGRGIADVYVLLNNERKGNSIVIYIPGSLYFSGLEGDFGSPIPISSLRYAGDFLQEDRGVEYSFWQLNEILGLRAENYVWITPEAYTIINEVYGDIDDIKDRYKEDYILQRGDSLTNAFLRLHAMSSQYSFLKTITNVRNVKGMDEYIYSNLSFTGAMNKIGSYRRIVGDTQTLVIDLSSPRYSIDQLSDQGGQVRSINISEYDKALRRNFIDIIDRGLERERVRVEVYNGSGSPGKAGLFARRILNNGCDVVRFGNAPESLERTQVYVSDDREFRNSLNVVDEILFSRYELLDERPSFMTTGDIVVILGEDILQMEVF